MPAPREKAPSLPAACQDGIAVIGMAGQFPDAPDVRTFWKNLVQGKNCIRQLPDEYTRLAIPAGNGDPGESFCPFGGILEERALFDPLFFRISPMEAESMCPHQRLILMESFKALEDAGYNPRALSGSLTSVFIGAEPTGYVHTSFTGASQAVIASRLAYHLNLKGPAMVVDTACSSSGTAIHLACESLHRGDADMALAGGVFAALNQAALSIMSKTGILSPTGACAVFDASGNGTVMSEGVGVVVLKRLRDAQQDKDNILAVIRATGINHNGKSSGITAPNGLSQEELIRKVYTRHHIPCEGISFVEAHGTGTLLGDPVEAKSLARAFKSFTDKKGYCSLQSVKSAIGHCNAAAGVIALIKTILCLKHRKLPGQAGFKQLNPGIRLDDTAFFIHTRTRDLERIEGKPLLAAINSFGHSGTNFHAVIEAYAAETPAWEGSCLLSPEQGYAVPLSAMTEKCLLQAAARLKAFLLDHPEETQNMEKLCYTLQTGRDALRERLVLVIQDRSDLLEKLGAIGEGSGFPQGCFRGQAPRSGSAEKPGASFDRDRVLPLSEMAFMWSRGEPVQWEKLYGKGGPGRMSLPATPLDKKRYWRPEPDAGHAGKAMDTPMQTLFFTPCFRKAPLEEGTAVPGFDTHQVFLDPELCADGMPGIPGELPPDPLLLPGPAKEIPVPRRFTETALQVFTRVRKALESASGGPGSGGKILFQVVIGKDTPSCLSGIAGLLKTAAAENPLFCGQVIEVEKGINRQALSRIIAENAKDPETSHVRYENSERLTLHIKEAAMPQNPAAKPFRDNAVILITGGTGALGLAFARRIEKTAPHARIILSSRKALSDEKAAALEQMRQNGAHLQWIRADVADPESASRLVRTIQREYGALTGIFHAAGIVSDNYILKKDPMEFARVLRPKVDGLFYLDLAAKDQPLDFFACFSSLAARFGNPGQCDYAAANAFMDAFTGIRNRQVEKGERRGLTLSVNWPLWEQGGMQVDAASRSAMEAHLGIRPLGTREGLDAFFRILANPCPQAVVLYGDPEKIRKRFQEPDRPNPAQPETDPPDPGSKDLQGTPDASGGFSAVDAAGLEQGTLEKLKPVFARFLKLDLALVDADEPLESYGLESVAVTGLNQALSRFFPKLAKTLFFEHKTLRSVAEYLAASFAAQCLEWTGNAPDRQRDPMVSVPGACQAKTGRARTAVLEKALEGADLQPFPRDAADPIAVIGMAGQYPMAPDLETFWENLEQGRDCIAPVPASRWPLEGFFEADKEMALEKGLSYCKWGGFLDGFDLFDPLFFKIAPLEAYSMDPQERLFLSTCWQVMEDAGYTQKRLEETCKRRVGVFAGITRTGFELYGPDLWRKGEKIFPHTSFGSVANRVSYILNLKGPSMPVDTLCSSSLTAVHEACGHIRRGECDMAIAGGVNLYLHPSGYTGICAQQMLSTDGRCRSFGKGADGFVPGEGVGAVLLKPLSKALADGDLIYGLILSTAVNHDGRTNGYTVPSPVTQGELIRTALDRAGVNARSVSFVEAHGTATALGDPIEIQGLKTAFEADTRERGFCALGSVKSNIGHLESAAGIAALTKVLLQMRHGKIAPSLHSKELNPNIDFESTPFAVCRNAMAWQRPEIPSREGVRSVPRIAGVSSFGAGGANAHVIVQEYVAEHQMETPQNQATESPALVVLSAQTRPSLEQRAAGLSQFLEGPEGHSASLDAIAFTLQTGRESMEERMAVIAGSKKELKQKLDAFLKDPGADHAGIFTGTADLKKEEIHARSRDAGTIADMDQWIRNSRYERLAPLWIRGMPLDFESFYKDGLPARVRLPSYPFELTPYRIPGMGTDGAVTPGNSGGKSRLHPLIHRNVSSLEQVAFVSEFTGEEFFIRDHVVQGRCILPGAVMLEMAREAVMQALFPEEGGRRPGVATFRHLSWLRPVHFSGTPVHLETRVSKEADGGILFSIMEKNAREAVPVFQGIFVPGPDGQKTTPAEGPGILDLHRVLSRCNRHKALGKEVYASLARAGMAYGPSLRGIQQLAAGEKEALGTLSVPPEASANLARYTIHPSVADAATQVVPGLFFGPGGPDPEPLSGIPVPFELDELVVAGACTETGFAHVRQAASAKGQNAFFQFDIDVYDENRSPILLMKGFKVRPLPRSSAKALQEHQDFKTLHLIPVWDKVVPGPIAPCPGPGERVLCIGDAGSFAQGKEKLVETGIRLDDSVEIMAKKIQARKAFDHVLWSCPEKNGKAYFSGETASRDPKRFAMALFRTVKALLRLGYGVKQLFWTLVTWGAMKPGKDGRIRPEQAAVHGFAGAMAKEYPHWRIRLIDLPWDAPVENPKPLPGPDPIFTLPFDGQGQTLVFEDNTWKRQALVRLELPGKPVSGKPDPGNPASGKSAPGENDFKGFPEQGVVVVVGGAGGIGQVLTRYLMDRYRARVIWIGRKPLTPAIEEKIKRLSNKNGAPWYVQADATDEASLGAALETIKERHPKIMGLVHSAIVLRDASLERMAEEDFIQGLSPKTDACRAMARVFGDEPLDFVLFFSSAIAFSRAAGQSNYASGCVFKDAFARALSKRLPHCRVKTMNWGYWGETGIVANPEQKEQMARLGLGSIRGPEAMEALETLMAAPLDQMALVRTRDPGPAGEWMTLLPASDVSVLPGSAEEGGAFPDPPASAGPEARERMARLDDLLGRILYRKLAAMGAWQDTPATPREMMEQAQLVPAYEKWLAHSLEILAEQGLLIRSGNNLWTRSKAATEKTDGVLREWQARIREWKQFPDMVALLKLLDQAVTRLCDILSGRVPATDVLFPKGSMSLVEGLYKNNAAADYFNAVVAGSMARAAQKRLAARPKQKLRILEIGAGTGGTSAAVLKALAPMAPSIETYAYTDISRAFLEHGKKAFYRRYPFTSFRIFDAEKPLRSQGIPVGGFDMVVATNVLHATKEIRQTLRNAKAALAAGGLLVINEMSVQALFNHLTFGLLEGWWRFTDPELRMPGAPGLFSETWERVLKSEGFSLVRFPARSAHSLGQQVILAVSDGLVRQEQTGFTAPRDTDGNRRTGSDNRPGQKSVDLREHPEKPTEPGIASDIAPDIEPDIEPNPARSGRLKRELIQYLKQKTAQALKIPEHRIIAAKPLEEYGIDSILVVRLTHALRKDLSPITSTLFFEYPTLDSLADHLIATRKERIQALVLPEGPEEDPKESRNRVPSSPVQQTVKPGFQTQARTRAATSESPGRTGKSRSREGIFDIAVIGLSGRYPGAPDLATFAENLARGKNSISRIPPERWDWKAYFHPEKGRPGTIYSKWGGFLTDIDKFDPLFFRISPAEAKRMDPQERLFLETAWAALEDAGYTPENLSPDRKVGVFAGAMNVNYPMAGSFWSISNRVSFLMDFQGPSLSVDTACSSSLTAIHLACESIRAGTCDCALAGGVNLVTDPVHFLKLSAMTMLSATDRTRPFGMGADGFVDGEGVGVVVLKPLEQAIQDHDHIHGVIKTTHINSGGKTAGYTVPNPLAQARLIREALDHCRVPAHQVSYMEAHGTGTALGDPIEIAGLARAFGKETRKKGFCAIGSVKSNIGHTESAAGIAGLTKILLQMKRKEIFPSLHAKTLNPEIDLKNTAFRLQQTLGPWNRPRVRENGETVEIPRIAGLSAFGAGGANAHLIVQEYMPGAKDADTGPEVRTATENPDEKDRPVMIVLSAVDREALGRMVKNLGDHLERHPFKEKDLQRIAFTLQTGRKPLETRMGFMAASLDDLKRKLASFDPGKEKIPGIFNGAANGNAIGEAAADPALTTLVETWMEEGDPEKVLGFWVNGVDVDFSRLYPHAKPQKLALPPYPFARESYWLKETGKKGHWAETGPSGAEPPPARPLPQSPDEDGPAFAPVAEKTSGNQALIFIPSREPAPLARTTAPAAFSRHLVFVSAAFGSQLPDLFGARVLSLGDTGKNPSTRFRRAALNLFAFIQKAFQSQGQEKVLVQVVVPATGLLGSTLAGLSGLLRTMELENPLFRGQVILADPRRHSPDQVAALALENASVAGQADQGTVHVQDQVRSIETWQEAGAEAEAEAEAEETLSASLFRDGGVFLVTGALGGLGRLFSREIVSRAGNATLVLTGRSELTAEGQRHVESLKTSGASVTYVRLDISDLKSVLDLAKTIQAQYGNLDGILHSAGVIQDSLMVNKTAADFEKVLPVKTGGTVNLDYAFRDADLDFFILFSSGAGVSGNPGQADYAAANGFMDRYAALRNQMVATGKRKGKTLSVNWPLWKEGGMGQELSKTGMLPAMDSPTGIQALYRAMALDADQTLVLYGEPGMLRSLFTGENGRAPSPELPGPGPAPSGDPALSASRSAQKMEEMIRNLVSAEIDLAPARIDVSAPMEKYGIDSVMVMNLTRKLEKRLGPLSKTLFFEYRDIRSLAGYLASRFQDEAEGIGACATPVPEPKPGPEAAPEPVPVPDPTPALVRDPAGPKPPPVKQPSTARKQKADPWDIAIVGLAGTYPMARNTDEFWQVLRQGKNTVTEIPKERWDHRPLFDADPGRPGKTYAKWGGFIPDADTFDPLFFNISPGEAEYMDPQERLFLQCVYETLEDAGYTRQSLCQNSQNGRVGVFVGVMYEEYQLYGAQATLKGTPMALSGNPSSIANRVSYFCDFHGPSMAVDTMCSSSLSTIHLACQSIRLNECAAAVAGGVNLNLHPNKYLTLGQGRFASTKGLCESFGAGGDGYVPGEGVGAVLLKPLDRAIKDRDHIYGVIRATAVNHGGKTNGYTVPNPDAQAGVITEVIQKAGISADAISYIEAHGTGTALGDPIEIASLERAFGEFAPKEQACAIGSVKSNIGHCESAAGIAGVTKVLLQMKHGLFVPSLHSATLNPHIDFEKTPFRVQQTLAPWERPRQTRNGKQIVLPRIAGISAFGAGGSNAHVVIEEYRPPAKAGDSGKGARQKPLAFVLSAHTRAQLETLARRLFSAIRSRKIKDRDLADTAFTLQTGREAMEHRLCIVAASASDLAQKLARFMEAQDTGAITDVAYGRIRDHSEEAPPAPVFEPEGPVSADTLRDLARVWVRGADVSWAALYASKEGSPELGENPGPGKISLPTYPFQKERYWAVPRGKGRSTGPTSAPPLSREKEKPPLVAPDPADPLGGRFIVRLRGNEFFLSGHRILGKKVLPGTAYMEIIRQAAQVFARNPDSGRLPFCLTGMTFVAPFMATDPVPGLFVQLEKRENGQMPFTFFSRDPNGEKILHASGVAAFRESKAGSIADASTGPLRAKASVMTAKSVYATFTQRGIDYGPGHRCIETLTVGRDRVEATLFRDRSLGDKTLVFDPGMADAALQSAIGFTGGSFGPRNPAHATAVPFALESLEIRAPLPGSLRVVSTPSPGTDPAGPMLFLDFDMMDDQDRVCASIRKLGFKPTGPVSAPPRSRAGGEPAGTALADKEERMEKAVRYLGGIVSTFLKMPVEKIDVQRPLEDYGLNSIIVMKISERLEKDFGPLSKTLFYEYRDLEAIAGYFLTTMPDRMKTLLAQDGPEQEGARPSLNESGGPEPQAGPDPDILRALEDFTKGKVSLEDLKTFI